MLALPLRDCERGTGMRNFLVAILLLFISVSTASAQTWSALKEQAVLDLLQRYVASGVPSIAVGITLRGTAVLESAVGEAAPGLAATGHTAYRIGSVTKQFTAAAVLALQEDGATVRYNGRRFTIDEPVTSFFEGLDRWGPLPVRALLTMTAGLPDYLHYPPPGYSVAGPIAPDVLRGWIKQMPIAPGPWQYCNSCYSLLADVVAYLSSGASFGDYHDYLRRRIFAPAGMTESFFVGEDSPEIPQAMGHGSLTGSMPSWARGAGDIVTTAADMNRWNLAFFSGRILSPQGVATLLAPSTTGYGMGWFANGAGQWWHEGQIGGFKAMNAAFRSFDGQGMVTISLMTNSERFENLPQVAQQIFQILIN